MLGIVATSTPVWISLNFKHRSCILGRAPLNPAQSPHSLPLLSTFPLHFSAKRGHSFHTQFSAEAAASSSSSSSSSAVVGSAEYVKEPTTNVKFQTILSLPGCSSPLSLLGTGYREKVFAIIGVKIYAAGLYMNRSVISNLGTWKDRSAQEIQEDSLLFDTIFQAPLEKSLHIVLVRDVDGKTFWDALNDAISPRIKSPSPTDKSALSLFRSIFQGRPLEKGTFIFLTWPDASKMLVSVSSDGLPSVVDATIESMNVASTLFDVFFGGNPVSPSLKASVANGLAGMLTW